MKTDDASTRATAFPARGHELIARGVIIESNNVLVNRSRNQKTGEEYCALPGGHVDPGENCREAVRRELIEELGCATRVGDLLFVTESVYPGRHENDGRRHEIVLYFEAELLETPQSDGNGGLQSPESDKNFAWLPLIQLPIAKLLPDGAREFLLAHAGEASCLKRSAPNKNGAALYFFHDSTEPEKHS